MAKIEFAAVSTEELFMYDAVNRYRVDSSLNSELACTMPTIIDESADIDNLCENTKDLVGRRAASGFKNCVHLMKFIVGEAPFPVQSDWYPEGGIPEVIMA